MQEILDYLYGLTRFGIKPGLDVTRGLLDNLGNPQNKFKSIYVAGTNGKGSTSIFIASILQKAGYKVGLYTSPHLVKFNERIKINGEEISDETLVELTKKIRNNLEDLQPTFFEFTTSLAFLHFARNDVDIAIVEAGLGGRLDSTNVIMPELSVITNIDLDHTFYLGGTKEKIANEKAGIIKKGVPLVTAEEDEKILEVFKKKADKIYTVKDPELILKNLEFQKFRYENKEFKISLLGEYQIKNACTALLTIEVMKEKGFKISQKAVEEGLLSARWPARLQIFSREPCLIIDGAHNPTGLEKTRNFVEKIENRKVLIFGVSDDKDIFQMAKLITPLFERVIITQGNFKPADADKVAREAKKFCGDVKEIPNCGEAIKEALSSVKKDEVVLVTGSLYLAGDVLKQLHQQRIE